MPDATRSKRSSKKPRNARLTAVGGRAVDRVAHRAVRERPLPDAQRAHQRLLVADGRLVGVGRDDRHVADRVERLLEREEAARLDAVVVGHQDPRPGGPVAERPPDPLQRALGAAGARDGLAALHVEVPPLRARSLAGHVRDVGLGALRPVVLAHRTAPRPALTRRSRPAARRRSANAVAGRPPAATSSTSASTPGHGLPRTPDRPALAFGHALGRPVGDRAALAGPAEPVEEERGQDGRDRDPEDRADDAGDLAADDHRRQDDDRVDADGARHQPRRDHVHRHEPARCP